MKTETWMGCCLICGEVMRVRLEGTSNIADRWEMICPVDKWLLYIEKKARKELVGETAD